MFLYVLLKFKIISMRIVQIIKLQNETNISETPQTLCITSFRTFLKYMYIYKYISNIQSTSKDSGSGLFVYRIYEEFHINLWECSMYGCCYIFLIQVEIIKLTYRVYTMQLEENSNLIHQNKSVMTIEPDLSFLLIALYIYIYIYAP